MYLELVNHCFFYIDGKKEPFLSTVLGTVTKVYIHEWDILSYG